MKLIHHIWVTVYCKPEDNENEILVNLKKFFPYNLEEEKLKIGASSATSTEDRIIRIFQLHLQKQSHINKFIKHLGNLLTAGQKKLLLQQKESRLDSGNHFFIRFDKEKMQENEFSITDKGSCYHIKMSIAAFPTTRQNALKAVEEIFK